MQTVYCIGCKAHHRPWRKDGRIKQFAGARYCETYARRLHRAGGDLIVEPDLDALTERLRLIADRRAAY